MEPERNDTYNVNDDCARAREPCCNSNEQHHRNVSRSERQSTIAIFSAGSPSQTWHVGVTRSRDEFELRGGACVSKGYCMAC